jgi:hypothetical protein
MGLSVAGKNVALNAVAAVAGFASLHTAYPGDAGTSEVAGGSPAYARKALTWNAASGGAIDDSNVPVFDVPAATTVGWFGMWSLATAGVFYGSGTLGSTTDPTAFEAAAATDVFTADNHGLADGSSVVLIDAGLGSVIPTGVVEGTIYFVRDSTTDTFKLAATSGGAAIDLTVDGAGFVQRITTESFGAQGTYTLLDADCALLG